MGWYESQLMDLYMVLAIAPHSGQVSIWLPLPASPKVGIISSKSAIRERFLESIR
jgi:hypothetical protein